MTEVSKSNVQARLAQRPKQALMPVSPDELGSATERVETPSPAPVSPSATPSIEPSILSSLRAKGQIKKPTQAKKRDGRRKPAKTARSSSASGTASPIDIDSPRPVPESSASGAVRESLHAVSRTLAIPLPATTQPGGNTYQFPPRTSMPTWYLAVTKQSLDLLERRRPQELAAIDALKACITRCIQEKSKAKLAKEYDHLRDHVHKAESSLNMDKVKIKKTRVLTEAGLPRIFDEHASFPWDLKADAWHLYEKWMNEDFDRDILRGVVTVKGKGRNGDRLDHAYRAQHPRGPKQFGDNGAVLGQWWPSQLCAVRDGVHGAAQGGIYGDKEQGAYSIILSSGGYHDKDDGDTIEYSGTEGSNFQIKAATQSMITSAKLGNHIRVLRSSQLPTSNKYRPQVGLRYDGLYQIKSYKEINLEKQDHLFRLERIPGQQPIRSEGPAKRPTLFEVQEYDRCKGRI
ncbi:uncharacterized protein M421DRAFT_424426 [Didymella exigua CBS 183.55]|uniref:YDG domain-containing protein n=1 Tax=Didymella exigua CBS 183.55 TaxID=1150837 RepID=A0A6A5RBR2_9PLEO|nr:uncharacterized protein M421DRAFT_424426 [Didymella exigua CBS 183.55]KAF1924789.1 hypothetical protein M421DRAFT_424426 [Didymella exigua CBS 183.55]